MKKIRALNADEVECRVGQVAKDNSWLTLLLYKNARCDMAILDETFGAMNWQRRHTRDNANCVVAVFDEDKGQWVEKEDTGTESNTEAEKGLASDSFKRACTNWGIGRELYTSPLIFIPLVNKQDGKNNYEVKKDYKGNEKPDANFTVTYMKVVGGKIAGLCIENTKKRKCVFGWGDLSLEK